MSNIISAIVLASLTVIILCANEAKAHEPTDALIKESMQLGICKNLFTELKMPELANTMQERYENNVDAAVALGKANNYLNHTFIARSAGEFYGYGQGNNQGLLKTVKSSSREAIAAGLAKQDCVKYIK